MTESARGLEANMRLMFTLILLAICFVGTVGAVTPSNTMIVALIQVESGGNDMAIGDLNLKNKAYGALQIRQPVCDDVNRRYGTSYRAEDCLGNRVLSIQICKLYLTMWSKGVVDRDDIRLARRWNGGPEGDTKPETEDYAQKVLRVMKKYD